jgi:hypothetical protein
METEDNGKKAYKKPTVTQVKLEMGEAVLAACKAGSGDAAKNNKQCGHQQCQTQIAPS